jgi:hypothetical protein
VLSADLAAERLVKTNALIYLRLEGYGHGLNSADIRDAAGRWLGSVLFGQELTDGSLVVQAISLMPDRLEDLQADTSDYIFSRGRDRSEGHGEVHGAVKGDRDSEGNEHISGGIGGSYDFGNGWNVRASVEALGGRDRDGNVRGEVRGGVEAGYEF